MMMIQIASMLAFAVLASGADETDEVRSVLRRFNEVMRKPETQSFRGLFTSQSDYRDGAHTLKGPDTIVFLLTNSQAWSERTPPMLEEVSIRLVGPSAAFVDARVIQYGSTILKSSVPVVLLLEKDAGVWKFSSWRMSTCAVPLWRE